MSELEEKYQEIVATIKKPPPKKEMKHNDTRNNAKDQVERENAAAAEAESTHTEAVAQEIASAEAGSTFAEAVAQEIERRSMKCSSTAANQRVFQLSLSIDVRTGGRLHPVGVTMKRKAVNVT